MNKENSKIYYDFMAGAGKKIKLCKNKMGYLLPFYKKIKNIF